MKIENINNIPKDKFVFAKRDDLYRDNKFDTKPVSYFQGAFRRFCKNKGAVVGGIVAFVGPALHAMPCMCRGGITVDGQKELGTAIVGGLDNLLQVCSVR